MDFFFILFSAYNKDKSTSYTVSGDDDDDDDDDDDGNKHIKEASSTSRSFTSSSTPLPFLFKSNVKLGVEFNRVENGRDSGGVEQDRM